MYNGVRTCLGRRSLGLFRNAKQIVATVWGLQFGLVRIRTSWFKHRILRTRNGQIGSRYLAMNAITFCLLILLHDHEISREQVRVLFVYLRYPISHASYTLRRPKELDPPTGL